MYSVYNPDVEILDLSVAVHHGHIRGYIGLDASVSATNFVEKFELDESVHLSKFIIIDPKKFKVDVPHDYFIRIENDDHEPALFTLHLDKNSFKAPLTPGITKHLILAPKESAEYFYLPKNGEDLFEARIELRQVFDPAQRREALQQMSLLLNVYRKSLDGATTPFKHAEASVYGNKLYINFAIPADMKDPFIIHIFNPLSCGISLAVDLLNGNHKLLNLNERHVDIVRKGEEGVLQALTHEGHNFFAEMRLCSGGLNVTFFENNLDDIVTGKELQHESITSRNKLSYNLKVNSTRIFMRLENSLQ